MTRQRRIVSYTWRLRKVMAQAGMFATTDLVEPLAERGVQLSTSQVHRLVTTPPERLNLTVLAALCDILATTPDELILVESANVPSRKVVNDAPTPRGDRVRPIRAEVVPDTDQQ
jgi:DNA-binding Xre family transcriptional regulator